MELNLEIPVRQGQICKLRNPLGNENPEDVYILTEDPLNFDDNMNLYIVNLKDLQRNLNNPRNTPVVSVIKRDLILIADSLESYIAGWNK